VVTPLLCAAGTLLVLVTIASADVVHDPKYILMYLAMGMTCIAIVVLFGAILGISHRADAAERSNPAAITAIAGLLVGATACYAGGNVGNGPGWWVVLFSGLLATAAFFLLWWLVHRASGLAEKVTVDRDLAAGLRAAGFLVGCGMILGRAVAGDWVSAGATATDFAGLAWPAALLAGAVVVVERSCAPETSRHALAVCLTGWVPACVYAGLGIAVMLAWSR
jgi:hypothetical protein